ncbi:putative monooxygenase [Escovopsis weberi]|uniref:Putative monooxygenase n=1 Tax=Escovopsis weberi TaxID=150374 RepID=A0A0M9VWF5_ESCWE|nr:putative monooxygenase [Escovopsis weberi]
MSKHSEDGVTYSQFACIGSGFSAIALGATLKRWHGITDVRFFERHSDLGGTWFANQYPGCACDVPSVLYSFSFAPNPDWSETLAPADEIRCYLDKVAQEYDLRSKMVFNATVKKCEWIEATHRWRIFVHNGNTDRLVIHESQFLFNGAGVLVHPRKADIPGIESFSGPVFHSSQWRHDVSLKDKNVILIGNGCTASQIFPKIKDKTRHLTQFARSKHWVVPSVELPQWKIIRQIYRWVPGALATARFVMFLALENELRGFFNSASGLSFRESRRKIAEQYMRSEAPKKYHDLLIPDFEIGCKRRIFDSGYLRALCAENVTLTNEKILEVCPDGVRTEDGFTEADVIILATGFETNVVLAGIEVVGRNGLTAVDHWNANGGVGAYNTTVMSGFPNFFLALGPNSVTGNTSTVMAIENGINFALRLVKPVLEGRATSVDVKPEAEIRDIQELQDALQDTVYSTGCGAWYGRTGNGDKPPRNASTYPWWQPQFWYRCLFPAYEDFNYTDYKKETAIGTVFRGLLWTGTFATAFGAMLYGRRNHWDIRQYMQFLGASSRHLITFHK